MVGQPDFHSGVTRVQFPSELLGPGALCWPVVGRTDKSKLYLTVGPTGRHMRMWCSGNTSAFQAFIAGSTPVFRSYLSPGPEGSKERPCL